MYGLLSAGNHSILTVNVGEKSVRAFTLNEPLSCHLYGSWLLQALAIVPNHDEGRIIGNYCEGLWDHVTLKTEVAVDIMYKKCIYNV
jgi:hypothetical protein